MLGRGVGSLPGGDAFLRWAAGGHNRVRAPIFMLHRVLPDARQCYDPEMAVSVPAMQRLCAWLAADYEVVPLVELASRVGTSGERPLCALTFDDGWLDTYTHAFPVLQQYALPATVFLPLLYIGNDRRFWQERLAYLLRALRRRGDALGVLQAAARALPWCPELGAPDLRFERLRTRLLRRSSVEAEEFVDRLAGSVPPPLELTGRAFMNWDEVASMQRAGVSFGSHTLDHTLLRSTSPAQAESILRQSRQALSEQLGVNVDTVSYPWGQDGFFGAALAEAAGYACGVGTTEAFCHASSPRWRLPRIAVSESRLGAWSGLQPQRSRGLQIHLARTRQRSIQPSPSRSARQRLRLGFLLDNPEDWARPELYHGGSEIQVRHILQALDPEFFEIELYFLRQPPAAGLAAPWPWFAAASAAAGPTAVMAGVWRLLRQRRPALVQAMFQDTLFLGVPAAWCAGVPAILCARRNMGHWKRWYHRLALHLVNRLATGWQTNGRNIAEMLRQSEKVPAERIEILPNWMDLERFRPATPRRRSEARQQLGLAADDFIFVVVASYREVKNHRTLVRAAATLWSERPRCRILLLGEGPERENIEAQIALAGLGNALRLTGPVDNVNDYLAAADAGILSSWNEGCPNAVLEYMAAGLPVVASDIPAHRDLLPTQDLVAAGDATAWARALIALVDDPDRRQIEGDTNRQRAESYGSGQFSERVQAHYLRMATVV